MKTLYTKLLVILIAGLMLNGCRKDPEPAPEPSWQEKMDQLKVPNGFDYLMTLDATIEITMPFTVDYTTHRSRIDILTAPATEGGLMLASGSVDEEGRASMKIKVPAYLDSVYVSTESGSAYVRLSGKKTTGSVLDGGINFGSGYDTIPPTDTIIGVKITGNLPVVYGNNYFPGVVVQNLVTNGTFDVNNFSMIPEWLSPLTTDEKWHYTQTAQTSFSRYNDGGNYVARFVVPSGTSYRSGGLAQLVEASPGDLITMTARFKHSGGYHYDNRTWLYLIPRNAAGNSITYFNYQIPDASFVTSWRSFTLSATMPSGTVSVEVLLWEWIFSGAHYFDDIVVTGPDNDSDSDGVDDEQDDYPEDDTRAFDLYYPGAGTFNSLSFEDNWPGKGDYDFNDLVVDYNYHQVTNSSNNLVELYGSFVIRAIGASLQNGFGFSMNMDPSLVSDVEGISITKSYITLSGNHTEAGQEKATIIVTDDVFTQLPSPGGGTGVNTEPGMPYVTPDTMIVKITLNDPVSLAQAGSPPYNPFMIISETRGRELHLPDNPPTDLADPGYFGTGNDDSDPATGKYYKTVNNLPWGIDIPTEFDYPIERAVILQAYLHFGDWAQSGGNLYPEWYTSASGNRDATYIYSVTP